MEAETKLPQDNSQKWRGIKNVDNTCFMISVLQVINGNINIIYEENVAWLQTLSACVFADLFQRAHVAKCNSSTQ